jgi:3-methyl-2-oxobutanoate hydroxymethyltransferase
VKLSAPQIAARKVSSGAEPLVMVTAYDEPSARFVEASGADLLLVGDSLANVVLGHEDTLHVSVRQMCHHIAAARIGAPNTHIVGDMPWMSYHTDVTDAVRAAAALVRAGADSVKLEGGRVRAEAITAILNAEIPVMGHLGLTPQSVMKFGGFKVQGRDDAGAREMVLDAKAIAELGVFSMVVEGVPADLGSEITRAVSVPIIGIGAGAEVDGQVLVFHDLLGLGNRKTAKFVRQYLKGGELITGALRQFGQDVRSGAFPGPDESYS